jgi:hypothetical protein
MSARRRLRRRTATAQGRRAAEFLAGAGWSIAQIATSFQLKDRTDDSGSTSAILGITDRLAMVHALRKEPDAMLARLDRGDDSRDPGVLFLPFDDSFPIACRDDSRFGAVARKSGPLASVPAAP